MSWRTIVVQSHVKLSYKNGYMISRGEDVRMVHLSEINTVIIDSTQVSLTSYLLCELVKRKIKVIFCDEKRNPCSELCHIMELITLVKKYVSRFNGIWSMPRKYGHIL